MDTCLNGATGGSPCHFCVYTYYVYVFGICIYVYGDVLLYPPCRSFDCWRTELTGLMLFDNRNEITGTAEMKIAGNTEGETEWERRDKEEEATRREIWGLPLHKVKC